jgi:hypothetical protein
MQFDVKKLETCFADAANYEYRLEVSGNLFYPLLQERFNADVRVNEALRNPVFIAQAENGMRMKGSLAKNHIRVGFNLSDADQQKAEFESWLSLLP